MLALAWGPQKSSKKQGLGRADAMVYWRSLWWGGASPLLRDSLQGKLCGAGGRAAGRAAGQMAGRAAGQMAGRAAGKGSGEHPGGLQAPVCSDWLN